MNTEQNETYLYTPASKSRDALDVYFCFPSTYYVGMSALGFLSVFQKLDLKENINPHRIFTDSKQFNTTARSLVGFSFSFELDFIKIFEILEKMNIPILKADRDENTPLIFAGGPVVSANPEPFADFFDFINLGDGEESISIMVDTYKDIIDQPKKQRLEALCNISGVYVPEFFDVDYKDDHTINNIWSLKDTLPEKVCKHVKKEFNECIYSPILTKDTVFSDTFLVEVERGCSEKCFFCIASYLNQPVRWPDKDLIIKALDLGLQNTRRIGLLGALITEHPDLNGILDFIDFNHKKEPIKLTTSSLRADQFSPKIASILSSCGQKQVTISIEAGSESLRNSINKKLNDDDIFKCIKNCVENKINTVKIYGMVGLPGESDNDIQEMIAFIKRLKREYPKIELILSLNSFIPKSHTPFERVAIDNSKILKAKMAFIEKKLLGTCKVRLSSPKWDAIQALVSRGDRRLGQLLLKAYRYGSTLGSFNRAFKTAGNNAPDFNWYAYREKYTSEVLPWNHISV